MPTSETFRDVVFTKGRGGHLWGWFHDGERKCRITLEDAKALHPAKKKRTKKAAPEVTGD